MESSRQARRRAAGRSGGMFHIVSDRSGAYPYQYYRPEGSLDCHQSINQAQGNSRGPLAEADRVHVYDSDQINEDFEVSSGIPGSFQGLAEHSLSHPDDIPSSVPEQCLCTEMREPDNIARIEAARNPGFAPFVRGLKAHVSRLKDRLWTGRRKVKLRQRPARPETVYTVIIDEETSDVSPGHGNESSSLQVSDQNVDGHVHEAYETDNMRSEHGIFAEEDETLQAEANFEFFCFFPDPDEEDVVAEDYDFINEGTQEDHHHNQQMVNNVTSYGRDMRNHYEVLDLPLFSSHTVIAKRARQLMSRYHPDKLSARTARQRLADAQEFARVSLAKTELSDPKSRNLHDYTVMMNTWEGVPLNQV